MRHKLLLATLALPLVVLLALVLYVRFGDHRRIIEPLVGHLLDRRLDIAGEIRIEIGAMPWMMPVKRGPNRRHSARPFRLVRIDVIV